MLLPLTIRRIMKRFIAVIFTAIFITVNITFANGAVPNQSAVSGYLDDISRYQLEHIQNPSYGSIGGEWAVMGLARYGTITDSYISTYKTNLTDKLKSCGGVLSDKKYTEYARVVIALTAIEESPKDFAGYNLLKPLAELENIVSQGANGILYTLIALDCGNYSVPEPDKSYKGHKTTREKLVEMILDNQLEDGGWSIVGTKSDTDMTAIAIQALQPYCNKEEKVKTAVNRGLDRLGELQQKDGGFKTGNFANCESTAQVLTALSAMNISVEDSRFVKNGNTVLDGLMQYYHNGYFSHFADGDANQMATEQAMYALTAYYRSISGMNGLYEMKDGITKRILSAVKPSESSHSQTNRNAVGEKSTKKSVQTDSDKNTEKKVEENKNGETVGVVDSNSATIEKNNTEKETATKGQGKATLETDKNGETVILEETDVAEGQREETKKEGRNRAWMIVIITGLTIIGAAGYVIYKKEKFRNVEKGN